ncbi:MAG: hypothetical protein LCH53_06165 [Bacteroidetes bacterium]|nr:hypothetical protein [Bacteroidota bacterium]
MAKDQPKPAAPAEEAAPKPAPKRYVHVLTGAASYTLTRGAPHRDRVTLQRGEAINPYADPASLSEADRNLFTRQEIVPHDTP